MTLNVGQIFGNSYVSQATGNYSTNPFAVSNNEFFAYNPGRPKVESDFPPESFTPGYNFHEKSWIG